VFWSLVHLHKPFIYDRKLTTNWKGATSGIGRALARAIHALSSQPTVIVTGRRKERLEELVDEGRSNGGRIEAVQVDLAAGKEALKRFVDNVIRTYPQVRLH